MNLETKIPLSLWEAVRTNWEKRSYTPAVLDAFYYLSELLRLKSGTEGDGAALIGQALGGTTPRIKLNRLQTESDWNVQKGVEQLLRGFYQAVRNPRSHDRITDSEEDAQILIAFVGYLVHQVDQARAQFVRAEFLERVLDADFVPQARYAELLVSEIPSRMRIDVFLDVYRAIERWKPENMRHFLGALIGELTVEEQQQVSDVLSEDLKATDAEIVVRMILGSFPHNLWLRISETARLRIENKLIRSVQDGRTDAKTRQCRGGALATWGVGIFPYLSLKNEMINSIINKLWSKNSDERAYVFQYLFERMNELSTEMPSRVDSAIRYLLKNGDNEAHTNLIMSCPWDQATWSPALKEAYESFKAVEPAKDEDDIPF